MSHLELLGIALVILILGLIFLPEIQSFWQFITSFDKADQTEMQENDEEYR
jgi:hypothetical protein